jgi:drug/metabolite transporter (DMT)-like permease
VVLVATTPLQTAIIAALAKLEPLTARKVGGLLLGVAGVGVLVGLDTGATPPPWAVLCALFAGTMYGIAGVVTRRYAVGLPGVSMAAGTMLAAAVLLVPFAVAFPPSALPSWTAIAAMLALALVSTAAAFVLYFRLIMSIGPVKALTVNFLSPLFGVSAGILVLGERLTSSLVAGAALILCGLALVLAERRRPPTR